MDRDKLTQRLIVNWCEQADALKRSTFPSDKTKVETLERCANELRSLWQGGWNR